MIKIIKDLGLQYPENSRSKSPRKRPYLIVECNCGFQWKASRENVRAGKTTMCKTCQGIKVSKVKTIHGGYHNNKKDRILIILQNMISRCYDDTNPAYKDYGQNNVTVCDEWLNKENGYTKFKEWALSNGYQSHLVCDKDYLCEKHNIYPKVYSPSTCKWITFQENGSYTSKLTVEKQLELVNEYTNNQYTIKQLANKYNYTYQGILYILKKYNIYKSKYKTNPRTI